MNHDLASYSAICDISASRVSSNVTRLHLQKCLFLATEALIKFQIRIGQRSGSKIRIKSIKHVMQNYRHSVLHPTKSSCEMSTHTNTHIYPHTSTSQKLLCSAQISFSHRFWHWHSSELFVASYFPPVSSFSFFYALSSVVSKLWD